MLAATPLAGPIVDSQVAPWQLRRQLFSDGQRVQSPVPPAKAKQNRRTDPERGLYRVQGLELATNMSRCRRYIRR